MIVASEAYRLAEGFMRPLGRRWTHVKQVGNLAASLSRLFGESGEMLVSAALLHDIGYCSELEQTGFHPLDGARYLVGLGEPELASLVAHHTGARFEAHLRGLDIFRSEFPWAPSGLHDALTFCDLSTSPSGVPTRWDARVEEIISRYGADSPTAGTMVHCREEFARIHDEMLARVRAADIGLDQRIAGVSSLR